MLAGSPVVEWRLTALWTGLGTCLYVLVPPTALFITAFAVLAPAYWYLRTDCARVCWRPSTLELVLLIATAYLLVTASWSLTPRRAYLGLLVMGMASLTLYATSRLLLALAEGPLRAMAVGFYAGYCAVACILAFEMVFGHPLHTLMRAAVADGGPADGTMPLHDLNYKVAALAFFFWPAVLTVKALALQGRRRLLTYAPLLAVVPAIFLSAHQSSMLAIPAGAVAWLLASRVSRATKPVLLVAWVFACVAVVPIASLAYRAELFHAPWLWPSAQHRVIIWGVISDKILEAPFVGQGIASGRELGIRATGEGHLVPGTPFVFGPGPHAHNAYLQVWFEAGALGAALLCGLGLLVLVSIGRQVPTAQPILYATFATNAVAAATSFSLWGRMLIPSFVMSVLFTIVGLRLCQQTLGANEQPSSTEHPPAESPVDYAATTTTRAPEPALLSVSP